MFQTCRCDILSPAQDKNLTFAKCLRRFQGISCKHFREILWFRNVCLNTCNHKMPHQSTNTSIWCYKMQVLDNRCVKKLLSAFDLWSLIIKSKHCIIFVIAFIHHDTYYFMIDHPSYLFMDIINSKSGREFTIIVQIRLTKLIIHAEVEALARDLAQVVECNQQSSQFSCRGHCGCLKYLSEGISVRNNSEEDFTNSIFGKVQNFGVSIERLSVANINHFQS